MTIKKATFLLICSLIGGGISSALHAQESILPDFNYAYLEKLVAIAKQNYPRAKGFEHRIAIAKANVNAQRASWLDPFSFSYFGRSNDRSVNIIDPALLTGYQYGLSINPGSLLQKPFVIRQAKEQVKVAMVDQQEYALTLEAEVKTRYIAYLQAASDLKLQSRIAMDAESVFSSMRYKYEKGEITFFDYTTASQSRNTAVQAKIMAEGRILTTKISLEELLVMKLEEVK